MLCCRWHTVLNAVKSHLGEDCMLTSWHLNIFNTDAYGDSFQAFRERRGSPLPPLDAPASLPTMSAFLERGDMPTVESVRAAVALHEACVMHKEVSRVDGHGWHADDTMPSSTPPPSPSCSPVSPRGPPARHLKPIWDIFPFASSICTLCKACT